MVHTDRKEKAAKLMISAIIRTHNDGDVVSKAIDRVQADEIIVVDDASPDECDIKPRSGMTIIKTGSRFYGDSWNRAALIARGDVLVFVDPYSSVDNTAKLVETAIESDCIAMGVCGAFRGGAIRISDEKHRMEVQWASKSQVHPTATAGGYYAVPRAIFNLIGGWFPTTSTGYDEAALSMKAFFCGVPLVVSDVNVTRELRSGYERQPIDNIVANMLLVHHTLFDSDVFAKFWLRNTLNKYNNDVAIVNGWNRLKRQKWVPGLKQDFENRKIRTDQEFFDEFLDA